MRETLALHVRAWMAAALIAGSLLYPRAGWARPAPWSLISKATHPAVSPTRAQDQLLGEWIPVAPPRLADQLSLYDVAHQRLLVFGGTRGIDGGSLSNDLWELTLSGTPTWHLLPCVGPRPSARGGMAGIYDSHRDRIVLFGGVNSAGVRGDVWTLALDNLPLTWVEAVPAGTAPHARAYHSAAYDSIGDRMIMFGGVDTLSDGFGPPVGLRQDIWQLTLAGAMAWSEFAPPDPLPSPRVAAMAAVDPVNDRLIVFGGFDGAGLLDETWAYHLDGEDYWQLLSTGSSPGARELAAACVDPIHDRMLVSGGFSSEGTPCADTWSFGFASGTWTEIVGGGGPPSGREGAGLVYDSPRNRALLYGGYGETFAPDLTWTLSFARFPHWDPVITPMPPDRESPAALYDPVRRQMIVHGGEWQGTRRGDLWALSMDQEFVWSQPVIPTNVQPAPSPRSGHAAAYDPVRDRLILFGGADADSLRSDAYAITLPLDGTHVWEPLATSGGLPSARRRHAMAYDGSHDRMIVFGGETASGLSNEVWELTLGPLQWTKLTPLGTPPAPRRNASVIFDSMRDHLVVYGGADGAGLLGDAWVLDFSGGGSPTWISLNPAGIPPGPREGAAAVYDSIGERMFVYGGTVGGAGRTRELWALSLDVTAWTPFSTAGGPPAGRSMMAAAFDPVAYRLAIYGGYDPSDAWVLVGDISTPTLASLVSAGVSAGRAEILWQINDPGATVEVDRREESEEWRVIGQARADGTGRVTFTDDTVRPGHRYVFALRIGGDRTAEAWLDVPATGRLVLEGFRPNPSAGEASIAFTLPVSGSARLDVMDVSGRRLFTRTLGALDAGRHVVALEGLGRVPAGLYLLRLTQRGTSITRRATLLR